MTKKELVEKAIGFQEEINQLILKHRAESWLSLDLTMAQLKSIIYISIKGKVNFKELAEALNVQPSVVTGIVDRLVTQGMVKRWHVGSVTDRRVQWLTVTEKGQDLLDNIREKIGENTSRILRAMSAEDLKALVQGFSALIKAAGPCFRKQDQAPGTADNQDGL
jgi:DNA-binding MarR family transcriptional regulator